MAQKIPFKFSNPTANHENFSNKNSFKTVKTFSEAIFISLDLVTFEYLKS